jgi:hypothetical protein
MSDVPLAYPVPWLFIRDHAPTYGLKNASLETLKHVSFALLGPGSMPEHFPMTVNAGDTAWLPIEGDDLPRATTLVVRWRRQNDDEYLWRCVF